MEKIVLNLSRLLHFKDMDRYHNSEAMHLHCHLALKRNLALHWRESSPPLPCTVLQSVNVALALTIRLLFHNNCKFARIWYEDAPSQSRYALMGLGTTPDVSFLPSESAGTTCHRGSATCPPRRLLRPEFCTAERTSIAERNIDPILH
jgi:hypothetical protein